MLELRDITFGEAAELIICDKDKTDQITINDKGSFYGCFINNELVGVISSMENVTLVRIKSFYVKKSARNKGVGDFLLKKMVEGGENTTYTCFSSKFSQNLFKRYGFEVISEKKNNIKFMKRWRK